MSRRAPSSGDESRRRPADVVVVEGSGAGHRSWYVRLLLDELGARGTIDRCRLLVTEEVVGRVEWRAHVATGPSARTEVVPRLDRRAVRAALGPSSYLVVPDGDRWLPAVAWLALRMRHRLRGRVLLLRPGAVATPASWGAHVAKAALVALIETCSPGLRVLSLAAAPPPGPARRDGRELLDPVQLEVLDVPRDAWLVRHDIDPSSRVALVIGDVSERKCVPELLAAVRACLRDDVVLALVGRPSPGVLRSLEDPAQHQTQDGTQHGAQHRVRCVDGFVGDADFDTWVARADLVCVLHRNEGSSGVLLKAWATGTPVLVGASRAVVEAARCLGMPRVVAEGLGHDELGETLARGVDLGRRPPADGWQARTSSFAAGLLGPG